MKLPPLWGDGGEYDEATGFPVMTGPIYLQASLKYRHILGEPGEPEYFASEVLARAAVFGSHADGFERQLRDAGVILARAPKGSNFMVERRIFPMNEPAGCAWLEVIVYFPADAQVEDRNQEIVCAMQTAWNCWWMADDFAATADAPVPVLSRAVGLVNAGVHWRTALSMAALEAELEPQK